MVSKESKVIDISPLTIGDLEQVMDIEPVAFGSHHWTRQSFMNELINPSGFYYAAREHENERVLGYSGFWLIGEEAHVTTLAVHPDYRRLYVGERLLINDIIQARKVGADWVTLEVRVSNDSAQKLYGKYSFRSLGVRRNYYQDNDEDALVLWTDRLSSPEFLTLFQKRIKEKGLSYQGLEKLFLGDRLEEESQASG
ncbi:MAG TPA: ribosomal protein S18-alanine N-acetyltransferase [Candidatus Obscuribacter sp.]|nr:ribosomal protein S18-alanine N-acetyltransferase [Candidatus Obscuribacter sp.]HMY01829.1 ribosomal protein S18-alanine N-acetyltransferase [Candidatus Obscuribacter sp.]HMY53789.1 ribosomal protein S18-alanine N-acetyltransferase [Candidatus Obscuribacter sp.]HNA74801.1 ribosomal protein S18-alanine N-acetyltransferase [Candidatus Obscuribacter sp.]HNB14643.1 ribosomal protein S18-alanine N-acetyltransferase [Candidatus Obscuribacter sp.]